MRRPKSAAACVSPLPVQEIIQAPLLDALADVSGGVCFRPPLHTPSKTSSIKSFNLLSPWDDFWVSPGS